MSPNIQNTGRSLVDRHTGSKSTVRERSQTARTISARWDSVGPTILVVLLAAAASALGAPWPVATPLTVAAGVLTVRRYVRHRGRGWLDAVAAGVGGTLVVIIMVGMLLNLFPGGLSRWSWAGAMTCTAIAALLFTHHRHPQLPRPPRGFRRPSLRTMVLYALTGLFVASAAVVSVVSSRTGPPPDIALAIQGPSTSTSSSWASVIVSASFTSDPLQLLVDRGRGPRPLGDPFTVAAGRPHRETVPVSNGTRVTVSLTSVGDSIAWRRVTIDRSRPASVGAK